MAHSPAEPFGVNVPVIPDEPVAEIAFRVERRDAFAVLALLEGRSARTDVRLERDWAYFRLHQRPAYIWSLLRNADIVYRVEDPETSIPG